MIMHPFQKRFSFLADFMHSCLSMGFFFSPVLSFIFIFLFIWPTFKALGCQRVACGTGKSGYKTLIMEGCIYRLIRGKFLCTVKTHFQR